ncbi:MAG: nickel pincer cofactor biosynthesis protein LarC [Clostridium sp.]|nr:nickel pincer cofactor biosynthesis protein LarC [Clostridium sp.]
MKVLYFDCFSGISGDMVLGALIDLGVDVNVLRAELEKLKVEGFSISVEKKIKNSIAVTDFDVITNEGEHQHAGHQHAEHQHTEHQHTGHHHHHTPARNLDDIKKIIDNAGLNENVVRLSKTIFKEIAKAEAKVHNMKIDDIHFHEVGAIDSIVDIVGASICIDLLGVDRIYSSPLHEGTGFIECQHGKLPVPVPAVMEMLVESNIPYIIDNDVNTELITPTGIGIIKTLADGFGEMPPMMVEKVGYGSGKREIGRLNALRCIMGTMVENDADGDIVVLKTNVDDMSPEILGYVMDLLLEKGALEVFYVPVYMKKNRPGVMLTVLCKKDEEKRFTDIILRETSTLGVRRTSAKRYVLERKKKYIDTKFGKLGIKEAYLGGSEKFAPEFEDCKAAAKKHQVPLWKVYNEIFKNLK